MSIKIGTTNKDGSGSATNLSSANEVLSAPYIPIDSVYIPGEATALFNSDRQSIYAAADVWNGLNTKEVKIDSQNTDVSVDNFVDVDINSQDSISDVFISVTDSKRGEVHTGEGNDYVDITVKSNSPYWDNTFVVDTGLGNDIIGMTDSVNSQFTSVDIDAGAGDDSIDISRLNAAIAGVSRVIDGGNGNDKILGSKSADTITGGTGNDDLHGNEGDDTISGGFGDDLIHGDTGNDILFGNEGVDTFFFDFEQALSGQFINDMGHDVIRDLEVGETLNFLNVFDSGVLSSGVSLGEFSTHYGIDVIDNGVGNDISINIDNTYSIVLNNMGTSSGELNSLLALEALGINIDLT